MKMAESFSRGYKTLWEKEKLLIMSNFSFSHSVFKRLLLQIRKNQGLFGKGLKVCFSYNYLYLLTLSLTSPGFYVSAVQVLKTQWEKEKLLVTSNFSLSRSVFYPFGELSVIFIKFEIVVCKPFQFGRV